MTGRLSVIVGGQFGSEAKGHVTAWLAAQPTNSGQPPVVVRVAGPNAGHSAVGCLDDRLWALRQIPIAAVTSIESTLVIAAGSEVDFDVLHSEIDALDKSGYEASSRLIVDPQATWLDPKYIAAESGGLTGEHGSTGKGVGAARAARATRHAKTVIGWAGPGGHTQFKMRPTGPLLMDALRDGQDVIIEGTQGYGLGVHTGYYPFSTSSDCRAIDFLAMAGISPWIVDKPDVWVVVRPYPIRIAGNSGPLKDETSWEALGLPEEITTVTKRRRRVGGWDPDLVRDAVAANGGNVKLAFSMADQVVPHLAGYTGELVTAGNGVIVDWITRIENAVGDESQVLWIGTGPGTCMTRKPRKAPQLTHSMGPPTTDDGLIDWWMSTARVDAEMASSKAKSYGSNSLAAMGRMLGSLCSDVLLDDPEALELGCFAYAYGKMERVLDAIQRGELPEEDTWRDLKIYATMVQRIREKGNWPG